MIFAALAVPGVCRILLRKVADQAGRLCFINEESDELTRKKGQPPKLSWILHQENKPKVINVEFLSFILESKNTVIVIVILFTIVDQPFIDVYSL